MLQDLIDIIAAPQAVFTRLKERPAFLLPLLLVVVAAIGSSAGYLLLNDEGFVKDQIIEQALGNRDMPAETRRNAEKQIESMSVQTQAAISCAAIAIIVPLITAIYAAYLGMVNKFSAHQFSFKHWFSLASWTGIPNLIAALVSIVVLLTDATVGARPRRRGLSAVDRKEHADVHRYHLGPLRSHLRRPCAA
jgi:hypothetical protein